MVFPLFFLPVGSFISEYWKNEDKYSSRKRKTMNNYSRVLSQCNIVSIRPYIFTNIFIFHIHVELLMVSIFGKCLSFVLVQVLITWNLKLKLEIYLSNKNNKIMTSNYNKYPSRAPEFTPVFSGVLVAWSSVLCVCFVDRYLSFCTFSFGHCVVCSSSIYDSDCPVGVFKLFQWR